MNCTTTAFTVLLLSSCPGTSMLCFANSLRTSNGTYVYRLHMVIVTGGSTTLFALLLPLSRAYASCRSFSY